MALRSNPNAKFDQLKYTAAQARLPFERDAWLNLAFYLDEQYIEWNDTVGAIRRIAREGPKDKKPRPVINKIMHFVQQEHAMALQDKPSADVLTPTADLPDQSDSAVAGAYVDWVSEPVNANFPRQNSRAHLWALVAGSAYLKWVWNKQEKRPDIIPVSFFEGYPDPYAREFGKCRYFIHSQFMDVEQVYDVFGVEVSPGKAEEADLMRTELLRGMGSAPVLNGVTVNELWMKPCRRYPDGLFVVWTGRDQLVAPGPLPYRHKRLPFTQIGVIERPDSLHFMSPVKYLRSAQMALNLYHAQKIMNRNLFANPKWWLPKELALDEDPNDEPGQVLRGDGTLGLKPEIIQAAAMADNGDGQMFEDGMMHIVGIHEVSQAQVPGRVESSKAIELLKQSDADRLKVMRETDDASISEGFFQVLELARQYAPEEQLVHAYSREGIHEVKHFKAGELKPGFRVRVTRTSGLSKSRASHQELLMRLVETGILTDPQTIAEQLDLPMPEVMPQHAAALRLARNENLQLAKGTAILPNSWDDHAVHLREHNTYRTSPEYQLLDAEAKQRFEHHCQQHEVQWDNKLIKQARRAQIAAGQVPAPPQGAPAPQPTEGP